MEPQTSKVLVKPVFTRVSPLGKPLKLNFVIGSKEVPPKKNSIEKRLREEEEDAEKVRHEKQVAEQVVAEQGGEGEGEEGEEESYSESDDIDSASFRVFQGKKPFNKTAKEIFDAIEEGTSITIIKQGKIIAAPFKIIVDSSAYFKNAITFSANLMFDGKICPVEITSAHSKQLSPIMKSKYCLTVNKNANGKFIITRKQIMTVKKQKVEEEEDEDEEEEQEVVKQKKVQTKEKPNKQQEQPPVVNQGKMLTPKAKYLELKAKYLKDPEIMNEAEKRVLQDPKIIAKIEELARRQAVIELEKKLIEKILKDGI
jgi:hypothetical protein